MIVWAILGTVVALSFTSMVFFGNLMRASPGPSIGWGVAALVWLIVAMLWLSWSLTPARAQEHRHPPEHATLHSKFYKTWMMPDNRAMSCCNDGDCKPAQAFQKDGKWFARQDGDEKGYTPIPPQKVEQERDSPDGRSHLCGVRYSFSGEMVVFCFLPASGH